MISLKKLLVEVIREMPEPRLELPDHILAKVKGVSVPYFTPEDVKNEKFIQGFLNGQITQRQAKISSENRIPLKAPELAIFYLIATGKEKMISDWREFVALPANTIRETLRKFNKVINGKHIDNEKIKSAPLYNFAIGVFNAMTPDEVVQVAEKDFTEANRELASQLKDKESQKRTLSTQKSVEKQKKQAELIKLDFQKNRKTFPNTNMAIKILSKIHKVTPEFVHTVLSKADLI